MNTLTKNLTIKLTQSSKIGSSLFAYRVGRARITVPVDDFAPACLVNQLRVQDPLSAPHGKIIALDIEVLKPYLSRVKGCGPDGDVGVVIMDKDFNLYAGMGCASQ